MAISGKDSKGRDAYTERVFTVHLEDEVHDGLFLAWCEQLLPDGLFPECTSSMASMPLDCTEEAGDGG